MVEPIEMLFGTWTWVGPQKDVLEWGAHWRRLANTTEPSMCGGDAAFLSNYFDHLLVLSGMWLSSKTSAVHSVREWLAGFSLSPVGLFLSGSLVCVCALRLIPQTVEVAWCSG